MATQKFICPAVSVVVPLYNVEEYIGECLDSLLAQTFQDFEVIVVDDCSTDGSVEVVKGYAEKFGGRLKLAHMEKKSEGGGYLPRNKGVELSGGKYIFFLDSDDAITATALEELYGLAEKFSADAVRCEKFYQIPENLWNNPEVRRQVKPFNYLTGNEITIKEPLLFDENYVERIKLFLRRKLIWNVWGQLIRRDVIIDNELFMPDAVAQDATFFICELCSAKRFLIVPNIVNYYRARPSSVSNKQMKVSMLTRRWLKCIKCGVNFIDKFLSNREFFSRRPDLKHVLLSFFGNEMLEHLRGVYTKIPAYAFDELLKKEFDGGNDPAFIAFIFSAMNIYRSQLVQTQQRITVLENELKSDRAQLALAQKRIAALTAARRAN